MALCVAILLAGVQWDAVVVAIGVIDSLCLSLVGIASVLVSVTE